LSALAEATRRQREAIHGLVSALLARGCRVHPTGFARIDPAVFGAAPRPVAVRALARLIASIGGSPYPPAQDKVVRLCARVLDEAKPKAATLGRCRLIPSGDGKGGDGMLVCREVRGLPEPAMVTAAPAILWDGRFQLRFADRRKWEPTTLRLMALGQLGSSSDWRRRVAERQPKALLDSIPGAVLASMPALIDDEGVVHVPHLRPQSSCHAGQETRIAEVAFRPVLPLSAGGQFLV
jgi:tRNA(Ile)-lysidine synthase